MSIVSLISFHFTCQAKSQNTRSVQHTSQIVFQASSNLLLSTSLIFFWQLIRFLKKIAFIHWKFQDNDLFSPSNSLAHAIPFSNKNRFPLKFVRLHMEWNKNCDLFANPILLMFWHLVRIFDLTTLSYMQYIQLNTSLVPHFIRFKLIFNR